MVLESLKPLLKIIKKMGFLKERNKFEKVVIFFSAFFAMISNCLIWMYLFFNQINVRNISIVVEGAGPHFEILSGIFTLVVYNDEILEVLDMQNKFWEYLDEEIAQKKKKFDRLFKILTILNFTLIVITILIQGCSVVFGNTPFVCYMPMDSKLWRVLIGCMQNFSVFHIAFPLGSLDLFTAITFTELSLQMEQLNKSFSRMKNLSDIKNCVQHKNFLNMYIKCFFKCLNIQIFVACFSIMSIICTQLILMTDSGLGFGMRMKSFCFILEMLFQFGMYCIPASLLKDACENSTWAMANCDLILDGNKNLKMCLIIMIQNSQRELSIKAGGIFEINRAAYINMLKSTYSFYTLMNRELS